MLVVGLLVVAAAGSGVWWWGMVDDADGPVDCSALLSNVKIKDALGAGYQKGMSCSELGTALQTAAGGKGTEGHTAAQVRAMREILQGTDDALTNSGQKSIDPSLRLPLAELIADYAPDTYEIFKGLDARYVEHASDDRPWSDAAGVHMAVWDDTLIRVTRAVAASPNAYARVRDAQTRQSARILTRIPHPARGVTLTLPPVGNSVALGVLDAIAHDVSQSSSAGAGKKWRSDVIEALKQSAPNPPPSYESDPVGYIRGNWAAQLDAADTAAESKGFTEQGVRLLDIWAKGRADGFKASESLRADCRNSQYDRYSDVVHALSKKP
ncbi:hypothetical protein OG432_22980 [Streptomyces sp. NBC_00442]|uniref:hypothetical protein n=1 Tax=Streptomyces sp. NBC_00442 TaxID=2903651 RepID=UPI002E203A38